MSELITTEEQTLVFQKLSEKVKAVMANDMASIENSLVVANAVSYFRSALTPEIMAPIMALQGSKLGFRTDKDKVRDQSGNYVKGPGYSLDIVKDCFIEMSVIGLLPIGNHWNIIGNNSYPTKEGATYLLKKENLRYTITYPEYSQSPDKKTATVKAKINWTLNGVDEEQIIDFPVKSDAYTTFDALIGKCERKAKMWLYNKVSGLNITDGDIDDIPHEVVKSKINTEAIVKDKERERVVKHISASKNLPDLKRCSHKVSLHDADLASDYCEKFIELSASVEELAECEKLIPAENADLLIKYDDKKRELSK